MTLKPVKRHLFFDASSKRPVVPLCSDCAGYAYKHGFAGAFYDIVPYRGNNITTLLCYCAACETGKE